ncbi:lysophospholipase [Salirhabdus euzebyi]|uniref:Lysophospholipase n=1 Tax=Salirhabdus euzebyi TaxID=394506 RepID=A0A841QAX3_9BACI|nr:alpha/beta hydrolase [Salirhabdus euzebyi]MBB6455433.1 lysophospholipase [Salirhabdus euzebyi]
MKRKLNESSKGTVVLVHGAFEHSGRYEWLANKWYEAGYNVIYGDLPGQGNSEGIKGHIDSFDEYIDKISEWIEAANYLQKPIFLLGHSMGGLAVVRALEEKELNVDGVILSSPSLGICARPPKWVRPLSKFLVKMVPTFKIKVPCRPWRSTRNEFFHNRNKIDPLILKKVSIHWYYELERAIEHAFKQIKKYPAVPTLLMQAGKDFLVNVKDVKNWFQSLPIEEKKFDEWNHLYHEIFNEPEREEVFSVAMEFANEVCEIKELEVEA